MDIVEIAQGIASKGVREYFLSKSLSEREISEIEAAITSKFSKLLDLQKVLDWVLQKYDGMQREYAVFCAIFTLGFLNGYNKCIEEVSKFR